MKALLIVAHGSRRPETRTEIQALTERVSASLGDAFPVVDCAFLQWTEPAVGEQLSSLANRGATEIVVLPYLLATGTHVAADIPRAVDAFGQACPRVGVRILPHIGQADGMVDLLATWATLAG